ncbi:MAG TPA: type II secretion system protein N, partial [Sphingomonadaceae bacterium]|nr:type II secretion system protein N [Sphingomonadaceae bacterium]
PAVASTALIAAADGAPHAYAPGQSVPGGAAIETIAVDHVLLRVKGRLETLAFPRASAAAGDGPARTAPAPTPVSGAAAPIAQPRSARMLVESLGAAPSRAGYQLGPETAPALRGAGLRPGDIIETINGRTVADLDRDPQGFATAMRAGSARIAVVRDGQRLTFSIPLR